MNEEEEDKFLKENPVVFKKFIVKRKFGEGAFGEVYLGQTIEKKEYVALKVEPKKIAKPILQNEAFTLFNLAGPGIPAVKSFGKVKNYNVLVEPLLGKSLFDIFAENHKEMPMEDICLIAQQVLDRIQWVHSKFIVHRDIKPDNFLIGKKDPNVIYLIDFGLSQKYRSGLSGKHIRFGFTGKLTGTVRFASANALRGGEQSRRDDIESIGYMLVYFMKKRLPWQGVTGTRKMERYLKIYKMKKNTTPEELCKGLPDEMTEYIKYAKKLEFEQEPNYNYLRKLFKSILKRIHKTKDQLVFSWIKLQDIPNLKNPVNPSSRRESPQSRIYKKIKNSLEKERNMSSDSNDSKGSYQQVYSQANAPNIKKVNLNSIPDSELDQEQEKKINKRKLRAKEELNTMIANLDTFVDENAVDFENEVLLRGSKDIGENTLSKNTFDMNMSPNSNNLIEKNKNLINNFLENLELNNNKDNIKDFKENKYLDNIKKNINEEIKELPRNEDNIIDNNKNNIINDININNKKENSKNDDNNIMDINMNKENKIKNNIISQNINDLLNQPQNNTNQMQNMPNDNINVTNTKKKNNINPIFDSINNMIFKENNDEIINQLDNNEKKEKKNLDNIIKEEPNEEKENDEKKISLKISNLEGKEFTFNESLNFRQILKNENKQINDAIPESQEKILSADNKKNDNNYQRYFGNNKPTKNFNLYEEVNNIMNSQYFPGNNQLNINPNNQNIQNNQNQNKINAKKIMKPNLDKNRNIINNNLNINKMKINQNMKIRNVNNPQKQRVIPNFSKNSKDINFTDINMMNFPSDNNINNKNYINNEGKLSPKSNKMIKKIVPNKINNNNANRNMQRNKNVIKLNEPINTDNNMKPKYNNLTFEQNLNQIPIDSLHNMANYQMINSKEIKKKKIQNNNNNIRAMNENAMTSNKNNMGNNITNININIRNNYVQNNENNPIKKNNNNMDIKGHPNMIKNNTTSKLQNIMNVNRININPNLKKYSPKIQNRFQPRIIGNNQSINNINNINNNLYQNNQRIIKVPQKIPKSNLNIMINNPNPIKNINMKNLNNNFNMNNLNQMQFPTNPNEIIKNRYPNSVKNAYTIQFNKLGGDTQNMSIRNSNDIINPNINYGVGMPSKIQMNNYPNNNPNMGMKYNNNTFNINNNIQKLNNNNLNYPMYQYQPQII